MKRPEEMTTVFLGVIQESDDEPCCVSVTLPKKHIELVTPEFAEEVMEIHLARQRLKEKHK